MNLLIPIALALVTAVLLILFGARLGCRLATGVGSPLAVPAPDPVSVPTAVALPWFSREEAVDQLRALRAELELDGQYAVDQALLLFDICSYLGLDEGEIQTIVGVVWVETIVDEPADLDGLELEDG